MTQNVPALWKYLEAQSREPGADRVASAVALGSKMVGRWPGGAPLMTSTFDDAAKASDNTFTYFHSENVMTGKPGDLTGIACPLGSHIRRANPRDDLPTDRGDKNSVEMVRKHQMLRRGRAFGPPLAPSMTPEAFIAKRDEPDAGERGLHFICLVGHIGRQFEFVQRAWLSSPVFAALCKDADPIVGVHRNKDDDTGNASDEFTCQAEPVRRKYKGLPQFTQLVGGAYFFLPGIKAVRFIAGKP
jgi:deferrochelatase/peroxidase EfeB